MRQNYSNVIWRCIAGQNEITGRIKVKQRALRGVQLFHFLERFFCVPPILTVSVTTCIKEKEHVKIGLNFTMVIDKFEKLF